MKAAPLPEAREPDFMKFNSGNPELPHLPGAGASPVHGGAVWSTFFSVLGRAKTPLSRFWHSLRSASPGYSPGQPGRPWPMPVPYPGLHKPGGRRGDRDVPRKLALNATVLVLSWLYLGQPGALSQPGPLALGSKSSGLLLGPWSGTPKPGTLSPLWPCRHGQECCKG